MAKFSKEVEGWLARLVVDAEYVTAKQNQGRDSADFESYIDLFDAERSEKEYDWMSDIFLPEFPTQMLTQSAIDVSQYFQTREFVDVYLEDSGEEGKLAAAATKELINRTLNRRELYHYMKYIRAKNLNHLAGHIDIKCWWEQELQTEYDVDGFGEIIEEYEIVVKDHFNYEVLDPRNVFTDSMYAYSMQQRKWILIRGEKSLEDLKNDADAFGYFNLEELEKATNQSSTYKTETHRETVEDIDNKEHPENKTGPRYDILERYGKFWVVNDAKGNARPGIDSNGKVSDRAYMAEVVMSFAISGTTKVLIQFHHTPYVDADGRPYRPVIRGLCYIHPTRDGGVGDGKYSRELQIGINDTFNVSNDRTMLATMPTLKGKKYAVEDSDTVRIEPDHMIELNDPKDIEEMVFKDNTQAAMGQLQLLTNKMNQATSIFPTTMGDTPQFSSTTATAIAGADQRTNQRTNYKAMTFEYTLLTEMYWQIQQMTWAFAKPETGEKLMGDKVFDFDPLLNYTYKPLSQSIETSYAKQEKIKNWTQILSYVFNSQHPSTPQLVNVILGKIAVLMGDEYEDFASMLLDTSQPMQPPEMTNEAGGGVPASNQYGIPQSGMEQMARGV